MSDTLATAEVQPLLDDMMGALAQSLTAIKSAQASAATAQAKVAALEKQLEDERAITIEKVASAHVPVTFSDEDINTTVNEMVTSGLCLPEYQTKLAAQFKADPKSTLTALRKIAALSNTLEPSGFSVAKTAAASRAQNDFSQEEEDWTEMVRNGA